MKILNSLCVLVVVLVGLSACAIIPSPAGTALVTNVQGPVNANYNPDASKVGEACAKNWFGIVATGDASIEAARKAGNIRDIAHVDTRVENYAFVFGKYCTVVHGD